MRNRTATFAEGLTTELPRPLPSARALALANSSHDELERTFVRGVMPELARLAGWEFRGINAPGWAKLLGIKKFIKGFHQDPLGLRGYNTPVIQGPLDDPWQALPQTHAPKRFGFYTVAPVDATARDNKYLNSVLLDYGQGDNPRLDPSRGLRDYLVQVDENNPDLYLGHAHYAVGKRRIPTNFFILERLQPGLRELVTR